MGSLKKGLDKWDVVTPLLAGMLGGTADYGEGADQAEEDAKEANLLQITPTRRKPRPRSNMLT